jgi:tetratricopeptide (TPR) repeat protein
LAGIYYSRGLDFWGVQLQRIGELGKAASRFDDALKLNPDNVSAQINRRFNQTLRAGRTEPVDPARTALELFPKYSSWTEILNANGPLDDPSFCFECGVMFAGENAFFRQAASFFERVRELVPDYLPARMRLGELYLMEGLPDRTLVVLHEPLEHPENFSLAQTNETQLMVLGAAAYFQKSDFARGAELLDTEIARHPDDDALLTAAAKAYIMRGLFTNALKVVDRKLRSTPDDLTMLNHKGYIWLQLKNYDAAIAALNRVVAVETNNTDALFNRALAQLGNDHLDAARADYLRVQQVLTNSYQVAYGLGDIAWRQHDTNEAIRNYKIYVANADTNSDEAKAVFERLRALEK